jgi:hypothetical protein
MSLAKRRPPSSSRQGEAGIAATKIATGCAPQILLDESRKWPACLRAICSHAKIIFYLNGNGDIV